MFPLDDCLRDVEICTHGSSTFESTEFITLYDWLEDAHDNEDPHMINDGHFSLMAICDAFFSALQGIEAKYCKTKTWNVHDCVGPILIRDATHKMLYQVVAFLIDNGITHVYKNLDSQEPLAIKDMI